ncbi:MAG: hypothetical protein AAF960_24715 [Bacteroidota bacterium]
MGIGTFVQVKQGIMDPDYEQTDMSGWKGVITKKIPSKSGTPIIRIKWDIETIKQLSPDYIKQAIEDGCQFDAMNLSKDEVQVLDGKNEDNEKERKQLVLDLSNKYAYVGFDDEEQFIAELLETNDISVNPTNLEKYRSFLIRNLEGRVLLTGTEDFPWEERFVFGYGTKKEYAQMRKTRPSYQDTFLLTKLLPINRRKRDLVAEVKRQSDGKNFEILLSWLECVDKESANYNLLQAFSSWVVNY